MTPSTGRASDQIGDPAATALAESIIERLSGTTLVEEFLTCWQQKADQPTVLLLDEVDALIGDTLISLLRQLRAGYPKRPARFPQTVILCGVRDLRDYRTPDRADLAERRWQSESRAVAGSPSGLLAATWPAARKAERRLSR